MVRLGEDGLDALVDLLDDGQEVRLGALEVIDLLGEEAEALLQGGELLECQRIHLAEQRETPLGRLETALLLGPVVRIGLGLRRVRIDLVAGGGRGRRHELVRAVLGHEGIGLDPELLDDATLDLLDAQPLLRSSYLVAMHRVGEALHLLAELTQGLAHLLQRGIARRLLLLALAALRIRARQRRVKVAQHDAHALGHGLRDLRFARALLAALDRTPTRCPLIGGRPLEPLRASGQRGKALLSCAQGQTRLDLVRAGILSGLGQLGTPIGEVVTAARSLVHGQPLLELRQRRLIGRQCFERRLLRHGEAIGLGSGGARGLAEEAQLLCHGRELGIRLVQAREGRLRRLGGRLLRVEGCRELETGAFERMLDGLKRGGSLVDGGLEFDEGGRLARSSEGHVGPDEIAFARRRGQAGIGRARRVIEVIDDDNAGQSRPECHEELRRAGDDIGDPAQPGGRRTLIGG